MALNSPNDPYNVPIQPGESWLSARLRRHLAELIRLAAPTVVSRMGILTIVLADILMVGRYSTDALAYFAIGAAPAIPIIVAGVGLTMGTLVVSANAFGAGDFKECGRTWRRSLPYVFLLGTLSLIVCLFGVEILRLLGQTEDLAVNGGKILGILGFGMPAILFFATANFFLESIKRPAPGMVAMVLANIINVVLNWMLIEGQGGMPALGAEGAAWGTSACRLFLAVFMISYVWWLNDRDTYAIREKPIGGWRRDWQAGAAMRRIGYATGISTGVESTGFAAMSMFAGWLGAGALAAYTVSFNLNAVFFMFALGIGTATSVRVGIAYGRGDGADLRLAGWVGVGVSSVCMLFFSTLLISFPELFAGFYSEDSDLLALAVQLIVIVGFVLVMDGNQAVTAQALRGCRDVWFPTAIQTLCFTFFMIPLGYYLAFDAGMGAKGLVWSIFLATGVSFVLLSLRFHVASRRIIRTDERIC